MKTRQTTSLRGLRTFCVAARHESFSAAGDELFITPSAVSHQIKSLEEELGQRLFDRHARELRLTPTGQALYAEVGPLIERMDQIVSGYRQGVKRQSIRLSVQPFFASEFFVPRLGEFTDANPDLDIDVSASDESAENHPADADLSIRLFRSPPKNVESRLLFPLKLMPAGSRDFAKALEVADRKITSQFPLIIHESFPKAWSQWSAATGVEIPENGKATRLDSMIAVVRAAEQGIGAALVPVPIAEQWFRQKTIVPLFDEPLVTDMSYYLVWSSSASAADRGVSLRDWILARFTEPPEKPAKPAPK